MSAAFAKRLQQRTRCHRVASARATAAAAMELGGLVGAIRLLTLRQVQGLEHSPAAAAEERELLRIAIASGRNNREVQQELEQAAATAAQRRQQLLQQRLEQERQRRQGKPVVVVPRRPMGRQVVDAGHGAIGSMQLTPEPASWPGAPGQGNAEPAFSASIARPGNTTAQAVNGRQAPAPSSHSRKAKGEVGVRLGRKIDKLLAELREADQPQPAPAPAPAETAGADPQPRGARSSSQSAETPAGQGIPARSPGEQPAPEPAGGDPQPTAAAAAPAEPAQPQLPVVLTLEHEATPAAAPASAWAAIAAAMPAEAARLEAMAVLQQQLLELPAGSGGKVELTAGQAQTLLLALLQRQLAMAG